MSFDETLIENAIRAVDSWMALQTQKPLTGLQRAIIRGSLKNWTYDEIKIQESEAYHYEVSYIKTNVAPKLWETLTDIFIKEGVLKANEAVSKNNLFECFKRAEKKGLNLQDKELIKPNSLPLNEVTNKTLHPFNKSAFATQSHDLDEAPDISIFYGRAVEQRVLKDWIVNDQIRVIAVQGMAGIGKTTLVAKSVQDILPEFDVVIWRSLRYAPSLLEFLTELFQTLYNNSENCNPLSKIYAIKHFIQALRSHRCLIILDDWETILNPGQFAGNYLDSYQYYGQLIQQVGEIYHSSCILLISREKPQEVSILEGDNLWVRSLDLHGLKLEDVQKLLQVKGLSSTSTEGEDLMRLYRGNPGALKMVATTIKSVFKGNISEFLRHSKSTLILGDILANILNEQFERLSNLEQQIMYGLTLEKKPINSDHLQAKLLGSSRSEIILGLESLCRRSLLENHSEKGETYFTLQPIWLKFVTGRLIQLLCQDLFSTLETQDITKLGHFKNLALTNQQEVLSHQSQPAYLILKRVFTQLTQITINSQIFWPQFHQLLAILEKYPSTPIGYALVNLRLLQQFEAGEKSRD